MEQTWDEKTDGLGVREPTLLVPHVPVTSSKQPMNPRVQPDLSDGHEDIFVEVEDKTSFISYSVSLTDFKISRPITIICSSPFKPHKC